ncbi:hypothetical protein ACFYP4_19060 [Streptomyces sp. NPDC005551]|uniref:hypothetical protein n=1 Tax=unclassified Streptomyces TaxID=2593676 RepID=UPI0033E9F9E7
MAIDPTDPETFEDERSTARIHEETPEADAAEQHTEVAPSRDEPLTDADPGSANEADLAEQARVVSLDEDDYR